ncbi:MAG: hypothetical protein ACLTRP_08270 [Clostridioides difficile]|uniref:hypothetical protein n=1 Tax=Clostridium sp. TaxID=1506 RepID=UPI001D4B0712|nr:hypothetical protein [Clostridium sp.]MBS5308440.1 hypothetical protein [Clostridium sp.]
MAVKNLKKVLDKKKKRVEKILKYNGVTYEEWLEKELDKFIENNSELVDELIDLGINSLIKSEENKVKNEERV